MLDLLNLFQRDQTIATYKPGETIFAEGTTGKEMYVVLEGQVAIHAHGKVVEVIEPGGLFGEMALIDNSPRSAAAVAHSECKLAVISERRFTFLIQQTPYFALHVMSVMAKRLRRQTP
jgi:CRP/FNR family cyclic AMP-dependent transcriptional regulator